MKRFDHEKRSGSLKNILFAVLIFAIVLLAFTKGAMIMTSRNTTEQESMLNNAISNAIVQSYALNGRYPESLEAIVDEYQIIYDEEAFFVDYQVLGSNIVPVVTIIPRP